MGLKQLLPATRKTPEVHQHQLNIAAGNPGRLGCMDVHGHTVRLDTLVGSEWSATTAMRELELDILGLPGARLPANTRLPRDDNFHLIAWGGPSYASCAVIWCKSSAYTFTEDASIGSDRRIWIRIDGAFDQDCWTCFLYLPPSGNQQQDAEWLRELNGLQTDIRCLHGRLPQGQTPIIFLLGDWNVQPSCLGGGPDPCRKRDETVQSLLVEFDLTSQPAAGWRKCLSSHSASEANSGTHPIGRHETRGWCQPGY